MPLAVASMYQWRWHRSKVPLAVAGCAAWRGAEQKKAVQAVMLYRWAAGRTGTMSIQVTWVIKIAKFWKFPPNQSSWKEMFGSQHQNNYAKLE